LVIPVNARLVVVAFVVVPLITERFEIDDDALMLIPRVEVGVRAPDTTFQSRNELLMKSTPAIAVETMPEVPFKSPERDASLVSPETLRFVVVALVVVAFPTERLEMVDEAFTMMPTVEVGVRAPETMFQSLNALLM